jgi:hypothetical protein
MRVTAPPLRSAQPLVSDVAADAPASLEAHMSGHRRSEVEISLAHYLGVAPGSWLGGRELHKDLGLEPLDVVLFVLDLEDSQGESQGLTFPFEQLEQTRTAGELITTVASWLEDYDRNERLANSEEELAEARFGTA